MRAPHTTASLSLQHTGDVLGNVRIYSLTTFTLLAMKVAHDGEVLSLSYNSGTQQSTPGRCLLLWW